MKQTSYFLSNGNDDDVEMVLSGTQEQHLMFGTAMRSWTELFHET